MRLRMAVMLACVGLSPIAERLHAQVPAIPAGSGIEMDPFRIDSVAHLAWMGATCTGAVAQAHFSLERDIDASETALWPNGGFVSIGTVSAPFKGTFLGNGHRIFNLTINRYDDTGLGLFGYAVNALIADVSLENVNMQRGYSVGALLGDGDRNTIRNCHSSGFIGSFRRVGGLIGSSRNSDIRQCHSSATIYGNYMAGGLIGSDSGSTVTVCYASGNVVCWEYNDCKDGCSAGGLIGEKTGGIVRECFASGTVSGKSGVGGLVGELSHSLVTNCYAQGAVSGQFYTGGLVGHFLYGAVDSCYAAGAVSDYHDGGLIGSLIGSLTGQVTRSYWDTNTSGHLSSLGGIGKGTDEMSMPESYEGWNFSSVWGLRDQSYPYLLAMPIVSLHYEAGENGTIAGGSNQFVNVGSVSKRVVAQPARGHHFSGWSDGLTTVGRKDANVTNNLDVRACFNENIPRLIISRSHPYIAEGGTARFSVMLPWEPKNVVTALFARVSGDPDIEITEGSVLEFTPDRWGYQTVRVAAAEDDDDKLCGTTLFTGVVGESLPVLIDYVEMDDDCVLTINSPHGKVIVDPDQPLYDAGTTVTVRAIPDPDWIFHDMSPSALPFENPQSFTLKGDLAVSINYQGVMTGILPPAAITRSSFTARWRWPEKSIPEGELNVACRIMHFPLPGYEAFPVRNISELTLTNLLGGVAYYYRIRRRLPEGGLSAWSPTIKLRTGSHMPVFRHLPCESPVSSNIIQLFAVDELVSAKGVLSAFSSDTNAVEAVVINQCLVLRYKWKRGSQSAQVGLTLIDPETKSPSSYSFSVSKANGLVQISGQSALFKIPSGVAQDIVLENQTGATLYGVRVRVKGLDRAAWLTNRTGRDPLTGDPIVESPCVLLPGSQAVVRLEYNRDYREQARSRPARFLAAAILQPARGIPLSLELNPVRAETYDGMRIIRAPALVRRRYGVYFSDDSGETWFMNDPVRTTANSLIWMDDDPEAPGNRLYRVVDAAAGALIP